MEIPYTKFELLIALAELKLSLDDEEKLDKQLMEIENEMSAEFSATDKKELNELIAKHHGIGVVELINSPNYRLLCDEYKNDALKKLVKKTVEKMGITEKAAWAIIAGVGGLLD